MGKRNNRRSSGNGTINGGSRSNSRGRGRGRGRETSNAPSPQKPSSRGKGRNFSGMRGGSFEEHRGQISEIVWRGPNAGSSRTVNALKVGSLDGSGSSGSNLVWKKKNGMAYGYQFPSLELQEGLLPSIEVSGEYDVGDSQDFRLCGSRETKITAYVDEMPSSISPVPGVTYDCSYDFILGDSSHRGLGFEEDVAVGEASSEQMKLIDETEIDSSASEIPRDMDEGSAGGCRLKMDESLPNKLSSKNDPAFLSIGGIKLYTEDICDDECSDEEILQSDMSGGEESVECSESDGSEDIFDSGSSVDDDVVDDYLEGVGGCDTLLDGANCLVEKISDDSDDSSSDDITVAMEKLGGIALQEASMEHGMQKNSQSNRLKNYTGAKKWVRKDAIATKSRNRMMLQGVDLDQINTKLEQIVLDGVDIYSFQPMHPRDCSLVQSLAAMYRLRSSSQGSRKKRFVTVERSQHTSMPSSSDKVRLEKLLGPGDVADYPAVDVVHTKSGGGRTQAKRTPPRSNSMPQGSTPGSKSKRKSPKNSANQSSGSAMGEGRAKKKDPLANQPVSFIASGVMQSEIATEVTPPVIDINKNVKREECRSEKFAAFEVHTKGFGSKMMAKMGFVEGQGLGRDGGGMAVPIQVIQRPRSLGLGMNF